MKKISIIFGFILLNFQLLLTQTPHSFNYQAVIRNPDGTVVNNKTISLRLSILKGDQNQKVEYIEEHLVKTNQFGLVNLEIGKGSVVSGHFALIEWGNDSHFLKVETDFSGSSNFQEIGISKFLSVPYALYAEKANNAGVWDQKGNNINYNIGNVGIGNENPLNKLSIQGNADGGIDRDFITLINNSQSQYSDVNIVLNSGPSSNSTYFTHHSSTYYSPEVADMGQLLSNGAGLMLRASSNNGVIKFSVGTPPGGGLIERMRISKDGYLGIGTKNPLAKLQISEGDIYISSSTRGIILTSPNGKCWRVTIDNEGNFIKQEIPCPVIK